MNGICLLILFCITIEIVPSSGARIWCTKGKILTNLFELRVTETKAATADYVFKFLGQDNSWTFAITAANDPSPVQWLGTYNNFLSGIVRSNSSIYVGIPKPYKSKDLFEIEERSLSLIDNTNTSEQFLNIPLHALSTRNGTVCWKTLNRFHIANGKLFQLLDKFKRSKGEQNDELMNQWIKETTGLDPPQRVRNPRAKRRKRSVRSDLENLKDLYNNLTKFGPLEVREAATCYRDFYLKYEGKSITCEHFDEIRGCVTNIGLTCKQILPQMNQGTRVWEAAKDQTICVGYYPCYEDWLWCWQSYCNNNNNGGSWNMCDPSGQVSGACMGFIWWMQSYTLTCTELAIKSELLGQKVELLELIVNNFEGLGIVNSTLIALESASTKHQKVLDSLVDGVTDLVGHKKRVDIDVDLLFKTTNKHIDQIAEIQTKLTELDARTAQLEVAVVKLNQQEQLSAETIAALVVHQAYQDQEMVAMNNMTMSMMKIERQEVDEKTTEIEETLEEARTTLNQAMDENKKARSEIRNLGSNLNQTEQMLSERINETIQETKRQDENLNKEFNVTKHKLDDDLGVIRASGQAMLGGLSGGMVLIVIIIIVAIICICKCIMRR